MTDGIKSMVERLLAEAVHHEAIAERCRRAAAVLQQTPSPPGRSSDRAEQIAEVLMDAGCPQGAGAILEGLRAKGYDPASYHSIHKVLCRRPDVFRNVHRRWALVAWDREREATPVNGEMTTGGVEHGD